MTKFLAGGIRNPRSTSQIGCTLQLFMHLNPFIDSLQNENQNDEFIKILTRISQEMKTTDNSVTADHLISLLGIDPIIFSNIFSFIRILITKSPQLFEKIASISDLIEIPSDISTHEILSNIDIFDNSKEVLIFQISPQNQYHIKIDDELDVYGRPYILYSFVQLIGGCHYHITLRDKTGWISINDTSVIEISPEQASLTSLDEASPIELIAYINDLDMVNFIRRPVNFQRIKISNTQYLPKIKSDDIYNKPSNLNNATQNNKLIKIENLGLKTNIRSSNLNSLATGNTSKSRNTFEIGSSSDEDPIVCDSESSPLDHVLNEICKKPMKARFFDAKIMKTVYETTVEAKNSYQTAVNELKIEWQNKYSVKLRYRFLVDGVDYEKGTPSLAENNVVAIFERKEMRIFNDSQIENAKKVKVGFQLSDLKIEFKGIFLKCQIIRDIKDYAETFCRKMLHVKDESQIYIFFMLKKKLYKLSENCSLDKLIQQFSLSKFNPMKFNISINDKNPSNIAKVEIPIYQTEGTFRMLGTVEKTIDIEDTVDDLISQARDSINERPLYLMYFDAGSNFFKEIDCNLKLIDIIEKYSVKILRIQKKISKDDILFDFPDAKLRFTYPLKDGQDISGLREDVKSYLNIEQKIYLKYNKNIQNEKKVPKRDWTSGKFKYMIVQYPHENYHLSK
ncbi:hypothetical protein TRFO_09352 [Tritrichomonas foetus]|uniref:USP domain-containing protein n=1 Tax=Tritrichomonas foetus TaxID=1144522 RepID=A0A1J4JJA7_9EUKA|nr:hypothetical protein TRFO_09352 [Tritrichomonas foetus]|eukprot:OHS97643.1 hypothetical protein TRFO_09352 [Tritrichomonas foetus]